MNRTLLFLSFSVGLAMWTLAYAEESNTAGVEADELTYLEKESKVIATGNVEIKYDGRILKADKVIYNQETDLISANGNIKLTDSKNNRYFADSAELSNKLKTGTITKVQGRFSDDSLFAADQAERKNEYITILKNAIYTPCSICKGDRKKKPIWKITADRVKVDSGKERLIYRNAALSILDVPILYTPYLSHAAPNAKRKSGLLMPSYSSISTLGVTVKTPYYFNISPDKDATIEPIFTSEEGIILAGEFRHLTKNGMYELRGSMTNPKERDIFGNRSGGRDFRGHIEGNGKFSLDDNWVWGFNAKRSTDDTYLQRYKFGNEDLLTSRVFLEKISGRNYFGAESISFQGLNVMDDPDTTPLVLPLLTTHLETSGYKNSRWTFDGNALVLTRGEGVKSRRISSIGGWSIPYTTKSGHLFELSTRLRTDLYSVENVMLSSGEKNGSIGRIIPEVQLGWSYPLVGNGNNIFIEPIANLILSPHGGNPDTIPNEDSQELELSDVNIFSGNHFTGVDRVESGPRANYGIRGDISSDAGNVSFLFGQSFRAKKDRNFTIESGLDDNFSDYVGRVSVEANGHADLSYRFRMDKDDFVLRRNEVLAAFSFNPVSLNIGYVLLDEKNEIFDKQEIVSAASIAVTDSVSFNVNGRRKLFDGGGWISTAAGIVYDNECLRVQTQFNRDFVRDRDIEPSTSVLFTLSFKNLNY